MKKTYPIFILLLFTLVSFNCTKKEKDNPVYAIVLCDLSQTVSKKGLKIDQQGKIEELVKDVKILTQAYPKKSEFLFFPISEDYYQNPFSTKAVIYSYTDDNHEKQEYARVDRQLNQIGNEITAYSNKNGKWSCILTSLQKSADLLRSTEKYNKDHDLKYNYKLIIFSDMIESCQSSPMSKGKREEMEGLKNLQRVRNNMDNISLAGITFKGLDLDITVCNLASNKTAEEAALTNEIWASLFRKMSYDKPINVNDKFVTTTIHPDHRH